MRQQARPPHPFLPSDEERNDTITHLARNVFKPDTLAQKLELKYHFAQFRRVGNRFLVVYTPTRATNMQCSDWVNVPTTMPLRA